ncbi:hypothetical protein DYB28_014731 [Aphanomyces astaci]|uniref:Transmembrane protein 135 N-terminal domain-containing protein n=1 Tax=Aphanomyces astaci TaxID=112090 RepID=A0A9X8DJ54_APHAT|nr:hypothetical protein DYB28_014731 [Aphanomyces astaci]
MSRHHQPTHTFLLDAIRHAGPTSCLTLLVGALISSARSRQLKLPPAFVVAAGVGCGVFRFVHRLEHRRLAAIMGSMAFFRLCSYNHKHIVLSYAAVEAISTYYLTHFTRQYWLEHVTGVLVTSRLMYTFLFHPDWLLPSQLRMLDFQSGLSAARRASLRANLHDATVTRCAMLHPHTSSCGAFAMQSAGRLALRSVQIFVPLHLLSMLASLAGPKKQQCRPSLSKVASGLLRSVMFLTTNYLFPYMLSCQLPQTHHKVMLGMATLAPSLAQRFESGKRRHTILKAVACYSLITVVYQVKHSAIQKEGRHKLLALWGRRQEYAMWTVLYAGLMVYLLQRPMHTQNQWLVQYLGLTPIQRKAVPTPSPDTSADEHLRLEH